MQSQPNFVDSTVANELEERLSCEEFKTGIVRLAWHTLVGDRRTADSDQMDTEIRNAVDSLQRIRFRAVDTLVIVLSHKGTTIPDSETNELFFVETLTEGTECQWTVYICENNVGFRDLLYEKIAEVVNDATGRILCNHVNKIFHILRCRTCDIDRLLDKQDIKIIRII